MDISFVQSLQHLCSVKIASFLLLDNEIEKMLDKDLLMEYRFGYFERGRPKLWEQINKMVIKKVHSLAPSLQIKVAEYLRCLHIEIVHWMNDHDSSPQRKGFYINYRKLICWKSNGRIDVEQTAINCVRTESIDIRDRFIMACNYYLTDVILDLWDVIKVVKIQHTSARGVNAAVRLWVDTLNKGKTEPTNEMIEIYLSERSIRETDVPLRIASYFRFLCLECRRNYLSTVSDNAYHKYDFRSCLYQMEETELILLLELAPNEVLSHLLEWPFQSVFIKVATKVSSQLSLSCCQISLDYIAEFYILNGYNFSEVFAEFWSIIPDCHKVEIKKDVKKFKAYEIILKYRKIKQSKSLAETLTDFYFA